MKNILWATLAISLVSQTSQASNSYEGFVTPSEVTYSFNTVQAMKDDGSYVTLSSSPFTYTFKKTDADFAPVNISNVNVGMGRYKSVSVCFNSTLGVKIDGSPFRGHNGSKFNDGDPIYSVASDNTDANGIQTVSKTQGTLTSVNVKVSTSEQNCTSYYFPNPVCITDTSATGCRTGDELYTSTGKLSSAGGTVDTSITFDLYFIMDMNHAVAVDSNQGHISGVANMAITVGKPGAAIHMTGRTSSDQVQASLLIGPKKQLLALILGKVYNNNSVFPGMCAGGATANVTKVPSSSTLPTGINFFGILDSTGTGTLDVPSTSSCMSESACSSAGTNHFTGFIQSVGSSASVKCGKDTTGALYAAGWEYSTTDVGGDGSTESLPIVRVVDPDNLLNICSGSTHPVSGKTGSCAYWPSGTYSPDADGYF